MTDIGLELKIISLDTDIPFSRLASEYWELMQLNPQIKNPIEREMYCINIMELVYANE